MSTSSYKFDLRSVAMSAMFHLAGALLIMKPMPTHKSQSNKKAIFLIALVLIVFLSLIGATVAWYYGQSAALRTQSETTQPATPEKPPVDLEAAKILDRDLVRRLLVHDQQAVVLLDIELGRGQSPTLRKLASEMKTTREAQLVEIKALLDKWAEPYTNLSDYPQQSGHDMYPSHPGMATPEEITKLRETPANAVDAMFLELMTAHYSGSIDLLQQQRDEIIDEEIKSLVTSAITARSTEQSDLDTHRSKHSESGSQH